MKEAIKTLDGGHYNLCGEFEKFEEESNAALIVTRCNGCGETRVQSSALTDVFGTLLTIVAAGSVASIDFVTPPGATGLVIEPHEPYLLAVCLSFGAA